MDSRIPLSASQLGRTTKSSAERWPWLWVQGRAQPRAPATRAGHTLAPVTLRELQVASADGDGASSSSRPAEDHLLDWKRQNSQLGASQLGGSSQNCWSKGRQLVESLEQREEPAADPAPACHLLGGHHQSLRAREGAWGVFIHCRAQDSPELGRRCRSTHKTVSGSCLQRTNL